MVEASPPAGVSRLMGLGAWTLRALAMRFFVMEAYDIRLFAIKSYGLVIHEFDPWFNFRATQ